MHKHLPLALWILLHIIVFWSMVEPLGQPRGRDVPLRLFRSLYQLRGGHRPSPVVRKYFQFVGKDTLKVRILGEGALDQPPSDRRELKRELVKRDRNKINHAIRLAQTEMEFHRIMQDGKRVSKLVIGGMLALFTLVFFGKIQALATRDKVMLMGLYVCALYSVEGVIWLSQ